jgi:hypothetical protein
MKLIVMKEEAGHKMEEVEKSRLENVEADTGNKKEGLSRNACKVTVQ